MINYDRPELWEADVSKALSAVVPEQLAREIADGPHEYVDDALGKMRAVLPAEQLAEPVLQWIARNNVAAFHGTRLHPSDVDSVKKFGLLPLSAESRMSRLERALSAHPKWPQVGRELPAAIRKFGNGFAGNRVGQVHLTLSRSALVEGFNHYLNYGSEFDQHVAYHLFGRDGYDLLSHDGSPYVIATEVPGERALAAAHRNFQVSDLLRAGELPNMVREFLVVWAYRLHDPQFSPARLSTDCGLVFDQPVPANWVNSVELLGRGIEESSAGGGMPGPGD